MLNDDSIMPFGMHKGKKMEDIPATYFIWLWSEGKAAKNTDVGNYIVRNLDDLRTESSNEQKGIFKHTKQ